MRRAKRGLASLLVAVMLITALPVTAMAAGNVEAAADPLDLLICILNGRQYAVCQPGQEAQAADRGAGNCDSFSADNSYTIVLPEDTAFPCPVQFVYWAEGGDSDWVGPLEDVYASVDDVKMVNGHAVRVRTDSTAGGEEFAGIDTPTLLGYQDIQVVHVNGGSPINLRRYLQEELKSVKLSELMPGVETKNITEVAWGTNTGHGGGSYTTLDVTDGSIDLSGLWNYYSSSGYDLDDTPRRYTLQVIDSVDQLNKNAIRYLITLEISQEKSLLDFDAYTKDGKEIGTQSSGRYEWYYSGDGYYTNYGTPAGERYQLPVWEAKAATLTMKVRSGIAANQNNDLTAQVYEGRYATEEALNKAIADGKTKEITSEIWNKSAADAKYNQDWTQNPGFTVVLKRSGSDKIAQIVHFSVRMSYNAYDLLDFDLQTTDGKTIALKEESEYYRQQRLHRPSYNDEDKETYYKLAAEYDNWESGQAVLKMKLGESYQSYSGLTYKIYTGSYASMDELNAAAARNPALDVTDQIWGSGEGYTADYSVIGAKPQFTVVVKDGEKVLMLESFGVYVVPKVVRGLEIYPDGLYQRVQSGVNSYTRSSVIEGGYQVNKKEPNTYYYTMGSYSDYERVKVYPVDGSYYVRLRAVNPDGSDGYENIKKAVHGASTDENAGADIKVQLFQDYLGYNVSFQKDQPVTFTVFFNDGTSKQIHLRTLPGTPKDNSYLSRDTYFNVTGAKDPETGKEYDVYVMPSHVDSYFASGFQTLLILDNGKPVPDGTPLELEYDTGDNVRMYWSHDEAGLRVDDKDGGRIRITLTSGVPEKFSAASESGTHLRNYWITLVTQAQGPRLWVNGESDKEHFDGGVPTRAIYLGYGGTSYHDIFIANIGDQELDNLSVTLVSDTIELDSYWTIGETKTLDPFTTTDKGSAADDRYHELNNMAKIRLHPKRDENGQIVKGDISGTLTISAGGQSRQAPVTIKLTGKAGVPAITSGRVVDGVKYVPYSCLIQTNYISQGSGNESDRPQFQLLAGVPPLGVQLYPTGELYGVPRAAGTFSFTVGITQNGQLVDSRSFSMTIVENEDSPVWGASDPSYEVKTALRNAMRTDTGLVPVDPGADGEYAEGANCILDVSRLEDDQLFVSRGEYVYFRKLWLDGVELVEGVDYDSEPGSTRTTIRSSTLEKLPDGRHTIADEFRESEGSFEVNGKKYEGTLKRTSQNFYVQNSKAVPPPTPQPPVNNNNSGGEDPAPSAPSTSSTPAQKPSTPTTPTNPTTPTTPPADPAFPFTDVTPAHWFYNDVRWAYEQKWMMGVTDTSFAPNIHVGQDVIVTVLARMAGADLTGLENVSVDSIEPGKWYSSAAVWAKQAGMLPDYSSFSSEGSLSRDQMAVMLVKYLTSLGVDTASAAASPVAFADADQMSADGNSAFQVLYQYGIFNGVGDGRMDPTGSTTRAQFSALIHRISNFADSQK